MADQVQPIFILPEGTKRDSGKNAQKTNIAAAKLVAETVRTTLGPKGMDKMLVDTLGDVIITNDGVTILQEMTIEHPTAKMIVEVAKTQEDEVGDGTTTAVVIAGELLKKAEALLELDIHPTVIAKGYRMASVRAQTILHGLAESITKNDDDILRHIADTAMTGKGAESSKEHLSEICVKAVKSVMEEKASELIIDSEHIKLEKKSGGSIEDTELIQGLVIDKEIVNANMPKDISNAKIALIDSALEIKNTETDAKIQINSPEQMQAFLDQEEHMLKALVSDIAKSNANVVVCQKGIDDLVQHYLAKQGIAAIRRVKKSDMQALSRATNARIVNKVQELSEKDLGFAGRVREKKVGDEHMIYVEGCKNPKSVSIVIRGSTEHIVEEVKRAMDDALGDVISALTSQKVVGGAGASEIELAKELRKYAESLSGREQLAVNAFSEAMEVIPRTLAENAGLDPIDVIAQLKSEHDKKQIWAGINVFSGKVMDAWSAHVIEPLKIKTQAVASASEVAIMILRIDDVIAAGTKPQGPPPQMPDMSQMGM